MKAVVSRLANCVTLASKAILAKYVKNSNAEVCACRCRVLFTRESCVSPHHHHGVPLLNMVSQSIIDTCFGLGGRTFSIKYRGRRIQSLHCQLMIDRKKLLELGLELGLTLTLGTQ